MASAALLMHYYKMPSKNVFFINYGGEILGKTLDEIEKIKGKGNVLVISDFGMVNDNGSRMGDVLSEFKVRGNHIIWLDHHVWKEKEIEKMSKFCDFMVVGENLNFCGTELVYKFLCEKDNFGDELARITHFADFALKSKSDADNLLIKKITMAMHSMGDDSPTNPMLREFIECLAKGDFDCKIINEHYERYMKETGPLMDELMESAEIFEVNGVRIAVGFNKKLSHQEACMEMIDRLNVDISIYISNESGHSSIRSKRDAKSWGVVSIGLATALGGGGHPLASGFSLEKYHYDYNDETKDMLIEKIKKSAKKLYSKKIQYFQQLTGRYSTR